MTCLLGWWIFFAILLAALDFPFQLPGKALPLSPVHPVPFLRPPCPCSTFTLSLLHLHRLPTPWLLPVLRPSHPASRISFKT